MSCGKCQSKINRGSLNSYIDCSLCLCMFHSNCVALKNSDIDYYKKGKDKWQCMSCVISTRSKRNDESPLPKPQQQHQQQKITGDICSPANNYDMLTMEKIYSKLNETVCSMNKRFDALDEASKVIASLVEENTYLKNKIANLELKVDKFEQHLLSNALEIINLSVLPDENIIASVQKLIDVGLNVQVRDLDIERCFRTRNRLAGKVGKVYVYFNNKSLKHTIIEKFKYVKKLSSTLLDPTSSSLVYVNECLTPFKKNLLYLAKKVKAEKEYKYLWMRNYNIMMRKTDGAVIKHIDSLDDLKKL